MLKKEQKIELLDTMIDYCKLRIEMLELLKKSIQEMEQIRS